MSPEKNKKIETFFILHRYSNMPQGCGCLRNKRKPRAG